MSIRARIAAATFATLQDIAQTITRVVLIGPAHYLHVHGIAAPTIDAFDTPLGRVPIGVEALRIKPTMLTLSSQ
jgi:AmmeMemoRadiSam system protein B